MQILAKLDVLAKTEYEEISCSYAVSASQSVTNQKLYEVLQKNANSHGTWGNKRYITAHSFNTTPA